MYPVSCTDTHRDIIDLVNHWMVKNAKTWISWEQNVTFLWNKKNLYPVPQSYCFVAEVTFKDLPSPLIRLKLDFVYCAFCCHSVAKQWHL